MNKFYVIAASVLISSMAVAEEGLHLREGDTEVVQFEREGEPWLLVVQAVAEKKDDDGSIPQVNLTEVSEKLERREARLIETSKTDFGVSFSGSFRMTFPEWISGGVAVFAGPRTCFEQNQECEIRGVFLEGTSGYFGSTVTVGLGGVSIKTEASEVGWGYPREFGMAFGISAFRTWTGNGLFAGPVVAWRSKKWVGGPGGGGLGFNLGWLYPVVLPSDLPKGSDLVHGVPAVGAVFSF